MKISRTHHMTKQGVIKRNPPMKCNRPQRAPIGDKHKLIVRSCYDNKEKIIRFGARGYEDYTQHKDPKRKASFRARHKCDEVTDKNTARYWSCEYLWGKSKKRV